jgi:hypothetical protein
MIKKDFIEARAFCIMSGRDQKKKYGKQLAGKVPG